MQQYKIAGHLIQVSGKGLNHIPGFATFSNYRNENKPLLTIQLNAEVRNWTNTPLHSFLFEEGGVTCDFAKEGTTYLFRMTDMERNIWLINVEARVDFFLAITNMDENTPAHLLRFAIWMAFGIAGAYQQTVALHASTISYAGKSILFLGESGTGKSTHTRLWLTHIPNSELLNDDSPFLSITEENAIVFGSPWSGKTPCYKNKQTPVAAIVRLSQAPYNKLTKLKGITALGALLPSCPPPFAYDESLSEHVYKILSYLLQQVPVYHLECLPNAAAAQLVHSTLIKDKRI